MNVHPWTLVHPTQPWTRDEHFLKPFLPTILFFGVLGLKEVFFRGLSNHFGPKWLDSAMCVAETQEYVRLKAYVLKMILSIYNMVM